MSSPDKKMKTTKKPSLKNKEKTPAQVVPSTPQSTPNPSLPDDLLLNCFACVSRLYYPTLSLVSKRFPSLLASPELYKTRSSLGHTESCLYVCLEFHPDPIPRWFTLCRKPDQTLTTTNDTIQLQKKKKKPSGYVLAKLTTPHSRSAYCIVTVGSDIYNIGGPIDDDDNEPSSSVSILDCRSHTWSEGPSMLVKRNFPVANVIDGKIYVAGGGSDSSSIDWMEVFDPKTQAWDLVSSPGGVEIPLRNGIGTSAGIDGNVYIFGSFNGLAYKTRERRWESVGMEMSMGWVCYAYCVIENVLYYHNEGVFKWYDTTARLWRVLKGVKGLPKFPRYCLRLADYGGKMAVLWERVVASSGFKDKMIWCAVIALERRNSDEVWGKVEWQDTVLTVPKSFRIKHALSATL